VLGGFVPLALVVGARSRPCFRNQWFAFCGGHFAVYGIGGWDLGLEVVEGAYCFVSVLWPLRTVASGGRSAL